MSYLRLRVRSVIYNASHTPRHAQLSMNVSCVRMTFQVKINPGAPIQIVQNGVTIRHPALPPVPESPPQPLPPLNLDIFTTPLPALSQFGNPTQQRLPVAPGPSSIFANGPYHNLFKREKNGSKRRIIKDETVTSSLTESEKSVAKRDTGKTLKEAASNGKVSTIKSGLNLFSIYFYLFKVTI